MRGQNPFLFSLMLRVVVASLTRNSPSQEFRNEQNEKYGIKEGRLY